jgi:hypothetical protein
MVLEELAEAVMSVSAERSILVAVVVAIFSVQQLRVLAVRVS